MIHDILESLERQSIFLVELLNIMKEEYELIKNGNPEPLAQMSFSMCDILAEVEKERKSLIEKLSMPLGEWSKTMSEEEVTIVTHHIDVIKSYEAMCKEQSENNKAMALGIVEQCRKKVDFIQKSMASSADTNYISSGMMNKKVLHGNFLEGTL